LLAYHGTAKTGLTQLIPFVDPHSNLDCACVYLSRVKALAALYIWDRPYKWLNFRIAGDGRVIYVESFPGALEEFYGGLAGSIYTCGGAFEYDKNAGIQAAVVSRAPVPVAGEDPVPDALERILEYEWEGLLEIRRYETLTPAQLAQEKKMILSAIQNRAADKALMAFIEEKFPELWAQGTNITAAPMKRADIPFMTDLLAQESVQAALRLEALSPGEWGKALRKNLRDRDEENFILHRGGHPAGWLKVNGLGGDKAWLSMLAVHPAHQGMGVGRFAVRHAEQLVRALGFNRLWLRTTADNETARAFYEKLGYALTQGSGEPIYSN